MAENRSGHPIRVEKTKAVALRLQELRCALRRRGIPATAQAIAAAVILSASEDSVALLLNAKTEAAA